MKTKAALGIVVLGLASAFGLVGVIRTAHSAGEQEGYRQAYHAGVHDGARGVMACKDREEDLSVGWDLEHPDHQPNLALMTVKVGHGEQAPRFACPELESAAGEVQVVVPVGERREKPPSPEDQE